MAGVVAAPSTGGVGGGVGEGEGRSAPAPPATTVIPVWINTLDRPVWVLKIPETVSELVAALPSGAPIATLHGVEAGDSGGTAAPHASGDNVPGAGLGTKRKREVVLQLREEGIAAAGGAPALKRTPRRWNVSLHGHNTARPMTYAAGVGMTVLGKAVRTGAVTVDPADPAWAAHNAYRRQRDIAAQSNKKSTGLAADSSIVDVLGSTVQAGGAGDSTIARSTVGRGSTGSELAAIISARGGKGDGGGTGWLLEEVLGHPMAGTYSGFGDSAHGSTSAVARSIYELFEQRAYWSIADLVSQTGMKEADVRKEVTSTCDYIRAGPRRGTYRLKEEFRTVRSVAPDPDDGITPANALSGGKARS